MRTPWSSDNRDLVKWSVLLHLARQHKLSVIVQLCFLNPHEFPPPTLDGITMRIPQEVIKQFRSLHSVETLSDQVEIKVFDHPFTNRTAYLKTALEYVKQFAGRPRAVFLDPDTGLSPRKPNFKHVTGTEARTFWSVLVPGDVIVLYQHQTNRRGRPWVKQKLKQFATALDIPVSRVKVAKGESIARDVVLYYASKNRARRQTVQPRLNQLKRRR